MFEFSRQNSTFFLTQNYYHIWLNFCAKIQIIFLILEFETQIDSLARISFGPNLGTKIQWRTSINIDFSNQKHIDSVCARASS